MSLETFVKRGLGARNSAMGKTFCNEGVSHEEGGEKLEEVQNLSLSLSLLHSDIFCLISSENMCLSGILFQGGGMYLVFLIIVIVTVIVLLQCLSCSFGQN